MTKITNLVIVLWLSFRVLTPQFAIAQTEGPNVASHKPDEQRIPSQLGTSPPKKAALSSEPENLSPEAATKSDEPNRVVQIGGDVNIGITETVNSIILVAGDAKIQGRVNGDILVFSGNVKIEENAQVMGKITVVLGKIRGQMYLPKDARNTADLYEEIKGWKLIPAGISLMMEGVPQEVWGGRKHAWFGWELVTFITLTLIHMLFVIVFPQRMNDMAYTISHRPIGSTLLGLLVMIIIPYLSMLLILSIVGIPLVLFFCAILLLMAIYGKTAIFLSIGNTIFPQQSSGVAVIVGYWIYRMATLIPYIHWLTFIIASTIGIGICIRTGFGQKSISSSKGYRRQYSNPIYR